MAKSIMPPQAGAYIVLKPKDSLTIKVDLLKGYTINQTGKYTVTYTSETMSGLKVYESVMFISK